MESYRDLGLDLTLPDAVNPTRWKQVYAPGLPAASTLADSVVREHLLNALSTLEAILGVRFGYERILATPVDAGEVLGATYTREVVRSTYDASDSAWIPEIRLEPTVLSVERVRLYIYGQLAWSLTDSAGFALTPQTGVLKLMPTIITLQGAFSFPYFAPWLMSNAPRRIQHPGLPNAWAVDYTRGPTSVHGQVPGRIERFLADYIAMKAGLILLPLASQREVGGVTSTSTSIDGISKSVSLQTAGAASIYAPIVAQWKEAVQRMEREDLPRYIGRKRGITVRGF